MTSLAGIAAAIDEQNRLDLYGRCDCGSLRDVRESTGAFGETVRIVYCPGCEARRRWQCKDIPDDAVIRAIEATPGYWRMWGQVWPRFEEIMPGVPYNVFVAKMRRLSRRGLVHACVHDGKKQCRGDIHLPNECRGC